jgi:hypothetical protein
MEDAVYPPGDNLLLRRDFFPPTACAVSTLTSLSESV